MASKKELSKDEIIDLEIKRLNKFFGDVDEKKKGVCEGLINDAAFMRMTLAGLKEDIKEKGSIIEMSQGKYSIQVEAPWSKAYNTMIQRYNTVMKELINLLPKDAPPKEESDGFEEFVMNR